LIGEIDEDQKRISDLHSALDLQRSLFSKSESTNSTLREEIDKLQLMLESKDSKHLSMVGKLRKQVLESVM